MGMKIIAKNKEASFQYHLSERYEAGISLMGTEVKVLREGKADISDAFVTIDNKGEVWLHKMRIPVYQFGNINNHAEERKRKLLLSRKEIGQILTAMQTKGLTVVPTIIYFKDSLVKVEIAMAKGKRLHDKREADAKRDVERKLRQGDYD